MRSGQFARRRRRAGRKIVVISTVEHAGCAGGLNSLARSSISMPPNRFLLFTGKRSGSPEFSRGVGGERVVARQCSAYQLKRLGEAQRPRAMPGAGAVRRRRGALRWREPRRGRARRRAAPRASRSNFKKRCFLPLVEATRKRRKLP